MKRIKELLMGNNKLRNWELLAAFVWIMASGFILDFGDSTRFLGAGFMVALALAVGFFFAWNNDRRS